MFFQAAFALSAILTSMPQPPVMTFKVQLAADAEEYLVASAVAGDRDGSGMVELTVDPGRRQICYEFTVSGLATPLMAHIHRGAAQQGGPSVVTLFTGPGELRDCLLWTQKHLSAIVVNPSNFYVNLSTTEFPDGALRGQLPG